MKEYFKCEVEKTIATVEKNRDEEDLTFCILSDSHYEPDGTWEDTAATIYKTLESVPVDAIIHLGDFTDGCDKKKITESYVNKMLQDLDENGKPVLVTIGNHDANSYKKNKEPFSEEEMVRLFRIPAAYYYRDFEKAKIRCLFLRSDDIREPVRYGFSNEEVEWVEKTLQEMPKGYKAVVFSHEAPLPELDYWSRLIRNGNNLLKVLESYNAKEDRQILAYIHGHTHAEYVYEKCSFPIISISCSLCKDVGEKKPKGAGSQERERGSVSQELWEILQIHPKKEEIDLVRFGAGGDRKISCVKRESTWRRERTKKRNARHPKIWAHRGSSGFAPENTIPAFEVAKELEVDGIELDVRMTKDKELVVIHDKTIDRTGDGRGRVEDFTLDELKQINFAKEKPAFGFVTIPTLRQVYEMFQNTDFVIYVNIEEKDSDAEECLKKLTAEMGMTGQVVDSSSEKYVMIEVQHDTKKNQNLSETINVLHKKGKKAVVKIVNDPQQAMDLKEMGADVIITDHPGKMRDLLTEL